jgi:hypothetical protein
MADGADRCLAGDCGGSGVLVGSLPGQPFYRRLRSVRTSSPWQSPPALVISAIVAGRGPTRGRLVWLGVVTYVVYAYLTYAFGVRFNPLFLAYLALLACSLYALIGGLATGLRGRWAHFTARTLVKAVSVHLAAVAVCSTSCG